MSTAIATVTSQDLFTARMKMSGIHDRMKLVSPEKYDPKAVEELMTALDKFIQKESLDGIHEAYHAS